MNRRYLIISLFLIGIIIGCNEDTANEPEQDLIYSTEIKELFPVSSGTSYTFSIDTLNLSTHTFENIGTRIWGIGNKVEDGQYGYFDCSESYNILNNIKEATSRFRLTNNSVDLYSDSSGISGLIPDSIEVEISLDLDQVFKLIIFPYNDDSEWNVFNGVANFGTFKFNVFRISGKYSGSENLQLDGFPEIIRTEKFTYTVVMNIPNITDPFADYTQIYDASIWVSPSLGIVKIEGCDMFINPITGGQFDDADSNKVSRHVLTSLSTQ